MFFFLVLGYFTEDNFFLVLSICKKIYIIDFNSWFKCVNILVLTHRVAVDIVELESLCYGRMSLCIYSGVV